jgi:hypothetical protein
MNHLSMAFRACAVALAATWMGGCGTPSVHPIYTKDTVIEDERIVGTWRDEDGKTIYAVSPTKESVYRLHVGSASKGNDDKGVDSDLELRLVQLGGNRFIDVCAAAADRSRVGDKHGTLFVPTHMFARVKVEGDAVTVWILKQDWARKMMNDRSSGFSATPLDEKEDGPILITSDTDKLQAFLKTHAEEEDAWQVVTLRRVKDGGAK